MSKILITGASGFVGSHLVEEALSRGLKVHAGVRTTSSRKYLQDERIGIINMDFNDKATLTSLLVQEQYDYIVHNAGVTKASGDQAFLKVNRDYTQNLIESISESSIALKKFLYTSSIAAYGPADDSPFDIISNKLDPQPVTAYGRSKLAAEQYIQAQTQLPYVIVRPTAVYGPRDFDFLTLYKTIAKGIGAQIGFNTQRFSFIFITDLVRAMLDLVESTHEKKAYFIGDGNSYGGQEVNDILAESISKKIIKIKIPLPLIKAVAGINELYSRISGKTTILNFDKVNELKGLNWTCDIEPLRQDVNFEAQHDLKAGVSKTTDWYKKEKLI